MASNCFAKSRIPLRSYLLAEKSSFQSFIENALEKTRQLLRGFHREKSKLSSEAFRGQQRFPLEKFEVKCGPTLSPKSKFVFYRPGFIHNVTSKWVTDSLAAAMNKEARRKLMRRGGAPMLGFIGFALAKKPSLLTDEEECEGVSYLIRDSFSFIPWHTKGLNVKDVNKKGFSLEDLKFGDMIAKGCNAAVYSARFVSQNAEVTKTNQRDLTAEISSSMQSLNNTAVEEKALEVRNENKNNQNQIEEKIDNLQSHSKLIISHSEGEVDLKCSEPEQSEGDKSVQLQIKDFAEYNLAVKIMFNYSAESNAYAIWNAMHKETLPVLTEFSWGEIGKHKVRKKRLKPHPNVVEMYFAFADQLPLLPGALKDYPQALPVRLLQDGCGRNMTLFLAMKRYHYSLIHYLKARVPTPQISLLLFTQLMEALVHLHQNGITHRDLKTDNILIDLSQGINSPKLAITDFGCCLESLSLNYVSYDISKGGNMALMAPEVVNAEPGPFSDIDYSKSDLWTAGTMAYEIFGEANPFYSSNSSMKSNSYNENDLPSLPANTPLVIQRLVKDMLHINPKQRPSQNFVATVCQILLHAPSDLMTNHSEDLSKKALEWMFLMSAETFLEGSVHSTMPSSVEFELRHTFCTRIQYLEVIQALSYIVDA